jgi:hypothetical protein
MLRRSRRDCLTSVISRASGSFRSQTPQLTMHTFKSARTCRVPLNTQPYISASPDPLPRLANSPCNATTTLHLHLYVIALLNMTDGAQTPASWPFTARIISPPMSWLLSSLNEPKCPKRDALKTLSGYLDCSLLQNTYQWPRERWRKDGCRGHRCC